MTDEYYDLRVCTRNVHRIASVYWRLQFCSNGRRWRMLQYVASNEELNEERNSENVGYCEKCQHYLFHFLRIFGVIFNEINPMAICIARAANQLLILTKEYENFFPRSLQNICSGHL